jgi:hypothetical protein
MNGLGRSLIVLGLILVVAGLTISCSPALTSRISALTNLFSGTTYQKITSNLLKLPTWLGRLPGDVSIKRDSFSFHFPLMSCLLISAILSCIMWLLKR